MPSGKYLCYVALGDSHTEGRGDGDDTVGLGLGRPARRTPRGRQPRAPVRQSGRPRTCRRPGPRRAVGARLALHPDLATVVAGVNDLLRPRFDAARVAGHLEEMFAALTAAGAYVVTLTVPDVGKIAPLARSISSRVFDLNTRIRAAADRHNVTVVETGRQAVATDARMWSTDRLHASPLGHERIAAAVAQAIHLPGSDDAWTLPLPPQAVPAGWQAVAAELRWAATFLGPWLGRRLRGRSSGDGRTAKLPQLLPVSATPDSPADTGQRESS